MSRITLETGDPSRSPKLKSKCAECPSRASYVEQQLILSRIVEDDGAVLRGIKLYRETWRGPLAVDVIVATLGTMVSQREEESGGSLQAKIIDELDELTITVEAAPHANAEGEGSDRSNVLEDVMKPLIDLQELVIRELDRLSGHCKSKDSSTNQKGS